MGFPPPPPVKSSLSGLGQNTVSFPPPSLQDSELTGPGMAVTASPEHRVSITPPSPLGTPHKLATPYQQRQTPTFAPPPTSPLLSTFASASETPYTPPHQASLAITHTTRSTPASSPAHVGTNNNNDDQAFSSPQACSPYYSHSPGQFLEHHQQKQQQQQQQYDAYAIHASVYRPTEEEERAVVSPGKKPGGIGIKGERLEKGVNKWLKRLDKGW